MPSKLNKTIRLSKKEKQEVLPPLPQKITDSVSGIFPADLIEALQSLPKNYFDLVIADPPYNSGKDFGNNSDKQDDAEYKKWVYQWTALLQRVSKENTSIYICCDWRQSSLFQDALTQAGFSVLNRITWKRD